MHEHDWRFVKMDTHFAVEPNTRRKPARVAKLVCAGCGQHGFRYVNDGYTLHPRRPVYTWSPDPANWITEL